jgi:hypothetical protein
MRRSLSTHLVSSASARGVLLAGLRAVLPCLAVTSEQVAIGCVARHRVRGLAYRADDGAQPDQAAADVVKRG